MTQEVQPLTWQKRTNIEEHQQFFAKINEIVGQLSGTVERSETALEEANTALTDARTAVTTANAASAQATEAATTVAGFNTRLTAVEVQAATNKSDISQLDIETQDLYDRDAQSVKLSSDHVQTVTGGLNLLGTNRAANTAVGGDDTQIANGHRIVQELAAYGSTVDAKLNAYSQMVRTSGDQAIDGAKKFNTGIVAKQFEVSKCGGNYDGTGYFKICEFNLLGRRHMDIMLSHPLGRCDCHLDFVTGTECTALTFKISEHQNVFADKPIILAYNVNGNYEIWIKNPAYSSIRVYLETYASYGSEANLSELNFTLSPGYSGTAPAVGSVYSYVVESKTAWTG